MIGSNRSLGNCTPETINNPNNDRDKTNCSSSTTTTCCLVGMQGQSTGTTVYLPNGHYEHITIAKSDTILYSYPPKVLFRCMCIHLNPHVLEWNVIEFSLIPLQHTWIETNTYASKQGLMMNKNNPHQQ
jgi:hypothetical protein